MKLLHKEECYRIMGACFEVPVLKCIGSWGLGLRNPYIENRLGPNPFCRKSQIDRSKKLLISYNDQQLAQTYESDFICFERIVVEIKVPSVLRRRRLAQVLNYLTATGYRLSILVNSGSHPKVAWERIVL